MQNLFKQHRIIIGLFFFLLLGVSSYFYLFGPMFLFHDFTHTARIAEMSRALIDNHFPVRWSSNFGFGFGMPLFNFYAPLPYYIGAFFNLFGFSAITSMRILFILNNALAIIASFLLCQEIIIYIKSLKKQTFVNKIDSLDLVISLVATTILVLAPYRAVNIYVRGALSEIMAQSFIILILWSLVRLNNLIIFNQKKIKLIHIPLTLSLTLLFLTHNITIILSLLILPFFYLGLVAANLIFLDKKQRSHTLTYLKTTVLSGFLAFFLSAFFLLPAFFEKDLTQINKFILSEYFQPEVHFVSKLQFLQPNWGYGGSSWGDNDDMSFFLGYSQMFFLAISAIMLITLLIKHKKLTIKTYWLSLMMILTALSIFLSSYKSIFIWKKISLLRYAQFPWRFLNFSIILISLLGLIIFQIVKKNQLTLKILLLTSLVLSFNHLVFFKPHNQASYNEIQQQFDSSASNIQNELSMILPDYLPQGFDGSLRANNQLFNANNLSTASIEVQIIKNLTQKKVVRIKNRANKAENVTINIANFPGWTVYQQIDSQRRKIPHQQTDQGLIQFQVSPGEHFYYVFLRNTPIQKLSNLLSILGLSFFVLYLFRNRNKMRKKHD